MASILPRLKLNISDIENGGKCVSWYDYKPMSLQGLQALITVACVVGVGIWIFSLSMRELRDTFIFIIPIFALSLIVPMYLTNLVITKTGIACKKREVFFYPDHIKFEKHTYDLSRVSRFEYGSAMQWNETIKKEDDHIQIRMWVDDLDFVIVGQNNWVARNNHSIQTMLSRMLQEMKSPRRNVDQNAINTSNSGIPEY